MSGDRWDDLRAAAACGGIARYLCINSTSTVRDLLAERDALAATVDLLRDALPPTCISSRATSTFKAAGYVDLARSLLAGPESGGGS